MELPRSKGSMDLLKGLRRDDEDVRHPIFEAEDAATNPVIVEHSASYEPRSQQLEEEEEEEREESVTDDPRSEQLEEKEEEEHGEASHKKVTDDPRPGQLGEEEEEEEHGEASHKSVTDDPRPGQLGEEEEEEEHEEPSHEEPSHEEDHSESNPLMMVSTPRRGQRSVPGFSSPPSFQSLYDDFERPDETQLGENLARELERAEEMDSDGNSQISANEDLDAEYSNTQSPEQADDVAVLPDLGLPKELTDASSEDRDAEYSATQSPDQADDIAALPDLGLPKEPPNVSSEYSHNNIVQPGEKALAEHEARSDAITEAIQETNAVAAQDCEQIFHNHKSKIIQIYVWVQFLKWLLRLDTKDIPPGPLEVETCLYGVKILGWLTGVSSAMVADSDWPTDSGDSSFSSSDDNPKPPRPLPPLEGTRAKLFHPLMYNYELYQRRLIYYQIWLHRKNHNFPHAKTRTSPAEMYGSIRDASYIFLITAVVSIVSLATLLLGCWMVSRMVKNAGWSLPSSLQLATDSQTPGVHVQNIRPTGIAKGTTSCSAFSQALDFAVMAASMNFSAAYTPHILLARQRASRTMFESTILSPWASTNPAHLAVFEAAASGDNVMDDIYSRIDLARNVVGPFQRGLLGLDSLMVAGEHDWVDSEHVAASLYGAREAQNAILGGIVEATHGMWPRPSGRIGAGWRRTQSVDAPNES